MIDPLHAEVASAFLGSGQNVDALPEGEHKNKAVMMGEAFTRGVDYLRTLFPILEIRQMMGLVWDIVGNKVVPVALGPNVPSLSLAIYGNPALPQTAIFIPPNWLEEVASDPLLQMGALVFVGSQTVDVYNRRLLEDASLSVKRARAHEAEFLLHVKRSLPAHSFNEYQQRLMAEYPLGLQTESVRALLYKSKPFEQPS